MDSWIYHSIVFNVSMEKFNFCTRKLYLCVTTRLEQAHENEILTRLNPFNINDCNLK